MIQPTNITPSNLIFGQGVIDVNQACQISWNIGNTTLYGFQIDIQWDGGELGIYKASTGIIDLTANPVNGVDAKGNPVLYTYAPIASGTTIKTWLQVFPTLTSGLFTHNLQNGQTYQYTITQFGANIGVKMFTPPTLIIDTPYYFNHNGLYYYFTAPFADNNFYYNDGDYFWQKHPYSQQGVTMYRFVQTPIIKSTENLHLGTFLTSVVATDTTTNAFATQYSANVINTRATPSIVLYEAGSATAKSQTFSLNSQKANFTATYTQAQGESINWIRWKLTQTYNGETYTIRDTGNLFTNTLAFSVDGLVNNQGYSLEISIEGQYGDVAKSTYNFYSSYEAGQITILDKYAVIKANGGVGIYWYRTSSYAHSLYKIDTATNRMTLLKGGVTQQRVKINDYTNCSQHAYKYLIFENHGNSTAYVELNTVKDLNCPISATIPFYTLIEAQQDSTNANLYNLVNLYAFKYNLSVGAVSNNNTPNWLTNFTPYRFPQMTARNGKSGQLQGLIGTITDGKYTDSVDMQEALYNISKSTNQFFLKDMKGNFYMVKIAAPITQTINIKNATQSTTISLSWEEVGDTTDIVVIENVPFYTISASYSNAMPSPNNPTFIAGDSTAKLYFTPTAGSLSMVVVDGATATWTAGSNVVELSNPKRNVSISISCTTI